MGGHQIIARHWPSEFEECISNTVFGAHHSLELRFECVEGFAEGNKVNPPPLPTAQGIERRRIKTSGERVSCAVRLYILP
jgi:hypothetical protein